MTVKIEDFKTIPHIRSPGWWALRAQKIDWAVGQVMAQGSYKGVPDEWMLRLHVAKTLENPR